MSPKIQKRLTALVVLLLLAVASWFSELTVSLPEMSRCPAERLCVVFLDVGQGDATFIQSPSGQQMLIDGGRSSGVLRELATVMGFFDRNLDYVLATHPDADHIGGLIDVLQRYSVTHIVRTENESDSSAWEVLENGIDTEGAAVMFARRGQRIDLGAGVYVDILFPDLNPIDLESNQSSIIAQVRYGSTTVMLTGDAPKAMEEYLVLLEGEHLKSDVLKVGHHGSRTSTSELFLAEVSPVYAVISAGADNSYGHPHVEVTDLLFNYGVETFSTAKDGTVAFVSDGVVIAAE